jgi:hypothetical protein
MPAPQDTAFPIDALGPDVRALFEHLECAVCLDLQADMQVVCEGGHSMCKVCYDGVCMSSGPNSRPTCPCCRNPMTNPRPNLAVNGVVAALGIQPRSAAPAPEVVLAIPVPANNRVAAMGLVLNSVGYSARLRRSVISKLKVRVRKAAAASNIHMKNRFLNQVADLGYQWRYNNFRPQVPPVHLSHEILAAFNRL